MLPFVQVIIGEGGVLSCTRCVPVPASGAHHHPAEQVADRIAVICDEWQAGPGPNVVLTGYEPLKHPDLPAIVTAAIHRGIERLALRSDARGLGIGGNARGAVASGVTQLHAVLLGPDAASHDTLASATGAFDEALRGLRAFIAAGAAERREVAVVGCVPVCRHNIARLPEIVAVFAREQAVAVRLELNSDLDTATSRLWLQGACDTGVANGVWTSVAGPPDSVSPDLPALFLCSPVAIVGDDR